MGAEILQAKESIIPGNRAEKAYAVVPQKDRAKAQGEKQACSTEKTVLCKAVCPQLDNKAAGDIWMAGGTCVLDVLPKLECDRNADQSCSRTAGGAFRCRVRDDAPLACAPEVIGFTRDFIKCNCHLGAAPGSGGGGYCNRESDMRACQT